MDKFKSVCEQHMPTDQLDKITAAKRELQRALLTAGIKTDAKVFKDILTITINNTIYTLELKDVQSALPEDQEEDVEKVAKTISAVMSVPDQKAGKKLIDPTAQKIQSSKKKLADKLIRAADSVKV